ncbi:MAG: ATP-binding cassette domain-containing protein, partial [Psychromonas sp.]
IGEDVGVNTGFQPPEVRASEKIHLSVEKLVNAKLKSVTFDLKKGEILGLGGLHGQGQSALLRALYGVESKQGVITYEGREIKLQSPRQAIKKGVAYVSGDRRRDGTITGRSILENVTPILFLKRSIKFIRYTRTTELSKVALTFLSTKYTSLTASIGSLSGGNQQKVIIARWLIDKPDILLLDDPTKGIDIVTKNELFDLIRRLASGGMSIILYSSEDAELLTNSDRILVFNNGAVTKELTGKDRTHFNLTQASFEAAQ